MTIFGPTKHRDRYDQTWPTKRILLCTHIIILFNQLHNVAGVCSQNTRHRARNNVTEGSVANSLVFSDSKYYIHTIICHLGCYLTDAWVVLYKITRVERIGCGNLFSPEKTIIIKLLTMLFDRTMETKSHDLWHDKSNWQIKSLFPVITNRVSVMWTLTEAKSGYISKSGSQTIS